MSRARGVAAAQVTAVIIRVDGTREDLGVISRWHANPLRRLWWRITTWRR